MMKDYDRVLGSAWTDLGSVPVDDDGNLEEEFSFKLEDGISVLFNKGVNRELVWRVFDELHTKGVAYLMYGDNSVKENKHG